MTSNACIENLTTKLTLDGQDITIRPINADDIALEKTFVENLSPQSRHFRFLGGLQHLSDSTARNLCEIDFDKTMAFIALSKEANGTEKEIGVSRYATDSADECEFAITIADEWQNRGLGRKLMDILIDFARDKGKRKLYSLDLAEDPQMRNLSKDLEMRVTHEADDDTLVRHELVLAQ